MTTPLILLDLDHTLITTTFEITDETVLEKIQTLQRRGISVGLNSDRPFTTLNSYAQQLQLRGLIICERGNVIHHHQEILFEQSHLRETMHNVRLNFIDLINQTQPTINLLIGNSEKLFFQLKALFRDQPFLRFVLMNKSRQFSIAFNSLQMLADTKQEQLVSEETTWKAHFELSQQLAGIFSQMSGLSPDLGVYRVNHATILHHPDTEKSNGTRHLLETDIASHIYMVGDTTQDFLGTDPRYTHCAVANAQPEYKTNCAFVAPRPFTEGVVDCLDWIAQNL